MLIWYNTILVMPPLGTPATPDVTLFFPLFFFFPNPNKTVLCWCCNESELATDKLKHDTCEAQCAFTKKGRGKDLFKYFF